VSEKMLFTEVQDIENSIFMNKRALKPNYPLHGISDILHRDHEIKTYCEFLDDIFRIIAPNNIFVYGKPGSGKTILTKWVLEEAIKEATNRNIELCTINVNCEKYRTENAIWKNINNKMPIPEGETRQRIGNSRSNHCNYFEHLVNEYPGIIVIILDEIDKAESPQMINNIIRTVSEKSDNAPCVIGITNDLKIQERFPPHLISVLAENNLMITPYNANQLADIIKARVGIAFRQGSVTEIAIELCAAYGAQEHGDARKAIDVLRVAGELAEIRKSPIVEESDVRAAREKIDVDGVLEMIKALPTQSKIVLLACIYSLNTGTKFTVSTMYNVYKKLCVAIDVDFLTQRRVIDLTNELDQMGIVTSTLEYKGGHGRNRIVEKISSIAALLEILLQDFRLQAIAKVPQEAFIPSIKKRN